MKEVHEDVPGREDLEGVRGLPAHPVLLVGRATGTSQLVGICLVETVLPSSILSIRNPLGEAIALTATPVAGGFNPVSAHLVITRLT